MIFRLKKLHILILTVVICTVALIFAIKSEEPSTEACAGVSVDIPIVMYHHITQDVKKAGAYTILVSELEKDFDYIIKMGYTPITAKDLICFVCEGAPLPDKPIMLTFDDGFESFYKLVFPILKQKNIKTVMSVIGYVTEKYSLIDDHNINYSNLTWEEIKIMQESGLVEIQNHSYNMHDNSTGKRKGMGRIKGENDDEYIVAISDDLLKLQNLMKRKTGIQADAVAYPFGVHNSITDKTVKELGFRCSFTCEEKVSTVTQGKADSLYNLGRFNRDGNADRESFFANLFS